MAYPLGRLYLPNNQNPLFCDTFGENIIYATGSLSEDDAGEDGSFASALLGFAAPQTLKTLDYFKISPPNNSRSIIKIGNYIFIGTKKKLWTYSLLRKTMIRSFAFPDRIIGMAKSDTLIAVACKDKNVYLHSVNPNDGKSTMKFRIENTLIPSALAFSPNGKNLAVGDSSGDFFYINCDDSALTTSEKFQPTLNFELSKLHPAPITKIILTDTHAFVAGVHKVVSKVNLSTKKLQKNLVTYQSSTCMSLFDQSLFIGCEDWTIREHNIETGAEISQYPQRTKIFCVIADKNYLVCGIQHSLSISHRLEKINVPTLKVDTPPIATPPPHFSIGKVHQQKELCVVKFAILDENTMAYCTFVHKSQTSRCIIINRKTFKQIKKFKIPTPSQNPAIDFSPDNKYLVVSATSTEELFVFDMKTRKQVWKGYKNDRRFAALKFSPDGTYLVGSSYNGEVDIMKFDRSGKSPKITKLYSLAPEEKSVVAETLVFSKDQKTLYVANLKGVIYIWDFMRRILLFTIPTSAKEGLYSIVSESNKNLIVSGVDGFAKRFNLEGKPKIITTFKGGEGEISCFIPLMSGYYAFGDQDGFCLIVEAKSGKVVQRFKAHSDYVISLCFDPSSQILYTGGQDGTLKEFVLGTSQETRLEDHVATDSDEDLDLGESSASPGVESETVTSTSTSSSTSSSIEAKPVDSTSKNNTKE